MNSFDDPRRVSIALMPVDGAGPVLDCDLPAFSVMAVQLPLRADYGNGHMIDDD